MSSPFKFIRYFVRLLHPFCIRISPCALLNHNRHLGAYFGIWHKNDEIIEVGDALPVRTLGVYFYPQSVADIDGRSCKSHVLPFILGAPILLNTCSFLIKREAKQHEVSNMLFSLMLKAEDEPEDDDDVYDDDEDEDSEDDWEDEEEE